MMASSLCRFSSLVFRCGSCGSAKGIKLPYVMQRFISVQQYLDKSEVKVNTQDPSNVDAASVLEAMKNNKLNVASAAELLGSLSAVLGNNATLQEHIQENVGFQAICRILGKDCPNLSYSLLITSYRNLLAIGMTSTSHTFKSVEAEVTWKLRRMSIKNLLYVLNVTYEFKTSELQKNVVTEIQRRWVEINDIKEICLLLSHRDKFNKEFAAKLEDRAIEIVEKAKADDIAKLFVVLANLKLRSTPLLRCMAFHLSKHPDKLDTNKISNVLCAINSLSFPDHLLLQRISSDLSPEIVNIEKSSAVAAMLRSLGQLRWKDEGLLDGFTQWIEKNFDSCRTQDLVAYMLTMAGLDYTPHFAEDLFRRLPSLVTEEAVNNSIVWLDAVWSMVVLRQVTPQHLESVLKPEFYLQLQSIPSKLKIRSINAAAGLEVVNYKGPKIGMEYLEDIPVSRSDAMQKFSLSVVDALSNFLPRGKFLILNKMTTVGIVIDAEFIVDSNSKPLPVSDFSTYSVSSKKLPAHAHRMALVLLDYKDFTLNTASLTGMSALNVRLLQKLGYLVVQVLRTDFVGIKTTLNKVQYLQTKIGEVVMAEKHARSKNS